MRCTLLFAAFLIQVPSTLFAQSVLLDKKEDPLSWADSREIPSPLLELDESKSPSDNREEGSIQEDRSPSDIKLGGESLMENQLQQAEVKDPVSILRPSWDKPQIPNGTPVQAPNPLHSQTQLLPQPQMHPQDPMQPQPSVHQPSVHPQPGLTQRYNRPNQNSLVPHASVPGVGLWGGPISSAPRTLLSYAQCEPHSHLWNCYEAQRAAALAHRNRHSLGTCGCTQCQHQYFGNVCYGPSGSCLANSAPEAQGCDSAASSPSDNPNCDSCVANNRGSNHLQATQPQATRVAEGRKNPSFASNREGKTAQLWPLPALLDQPKSPMTTEKTSMSNQQVPVTFR